METKPPAEPAPPRFYRRPAFLLFAALGLVLGMGSYTFADARGLSYLSNDPKACVNCHVMNSNYDSWQKSSHHSVATCNDCHVPHDFIPKYLAKAKHGWRHSYAFTSGEFHEPIQSHPARSRSHPRGSLRLRPPRPSRSRQSRTRQSSLKLPPSLYRWSAAEMRRAFCLSEFG